MDKTLIEHFRKEAHKEAVSRALSKRYEMSITEFDAMWLDITIEMVVRYCGKIAFDHWMEDADSSAELSILKEFGIRVV